MFDVPKETNLKETKQKSGPMCSSPVTIHLASFKKLKARRIVWIKCFDFPNNLYCEKCCANTFGNCLGFISFASYFDRNLTLIWNMFWNVLRFFFLCVLMSLPVLYLNVLVWLLTSCLFEHLYVSDALQQFVRDVFHLQPLLLIVLKGHLCVGWSLLLHTLCSDAAVMSSAWVSALHLHISVSVSLCVLGEDGPFWPTCLATASPQLLLGLAFQCSKCMWCKSSCENKFIHATE